MKALDIIDALIRMGNAEDTVNSIGIVETPDNPAENPNWLRKMFGRGGGLFKVDKMTCSNELKPNTKYIYVYEESISAKAVENCKVMVVSTYNNGKNTLTATEEFYLYEIE
jgi:hypothetical protein